MGLVHCGMCEVGLLVPPNNGVRLLYIHHSMTMACCVCFVLVIIYIYILLFLVDTLDLFTHIFQGRMIVTVAIMWFRGSVVSRLHHTSNMMS